jgi:hypothetical protein
MCKLHIQSSLLKGNNNSRKVAKFVVHTLGKKRISLFGYAIATFFGDTNPHQENDDDQQPFLNDLVFYICKGHRPLST